MIHLTLQEVLDLTQAILNAQDSLVHGEDFPEGTAFYNRLEVLYLKLKDYAISN